MNRLLQCNKPPCLFFTEMISTSHFYVLNKCLKVGYFLWILLTKMFFVFYSVFQFTKKKQKKKTHKILESKKF